MLIALISDIHGNGVGLEAALEDLERHSVDQVVCLGDAIQGGSQPAQVAARLRELGCPVVMGNSDSWILTGEGAEQIPASAFEVRDWTRDQLGEEGLQFVAGFRPTVEIDLGGDRRLLCFHGSPRSFDHVILPETPEDEIEPLLGGTGASLLAGGHTHLQWWRRLDGSTFFNPGSVGVAYNRHLPAESFYIYPFAEYAVLHVAPDHASLEFCRVPFDVDALEQAAIASGRPYGDREGQQYRPRA